MAGGEAVRAGCRVRLIVCCSLPAWTQRAPRSEQKARRSRLMTTVIRADAHSVTSDFLDGWLSLNEWLPPVHLGQLVLGATQAFEWAPLRPDRHWFSLVHWP